VIAYRRAAARDARHLRLGRAARLDGRAKELQGIGKTIEEKIVQIVEEGEIEALTKGRVWFRPSVVLFMRLPGLGRRPRRGSGRSSGSRRSRSEGGGGSRAARAPGLGAKSEEKILKALAFQADNPDEGRRLLGEDCLRCRTSSPRCESIRRAAVPGGAGAAAQGDLPRPRHHRHGDRSGRS
jgi:hypothetical protein